MDYLIYITGLLSLLLSCTNALYFHLGETEKKCFLEEIPDETMVVGKYKVEFLDANTNQYVHVPAGMGMLVEVKDPDQKVLMSRTYGAEGKYTFTSHTPGEHTMCMSTNSTRWFGGSSLRRTAYEPLSVRITDVPIRSRPDTVGDIPLQKQLDYCDLDPFMLYNFSEHANDYKEIAARDKLSELQLRVRQLLDQVDQITKEQNYQRVREERFRMTSESTNSRVLWWAFMQTCVLLAIGFWQMRHLKSFFEAKKLV